MKTKHQLFTALAAFSCGLSLLTAQDAPKPPGDGVPPPPPGGAGGPGGDAKARIEEFLKKIDTNGDGKISEEEFMTFEKNQSKEKFTKMDTNGDGFIDKAELEEAGRKMREARGARGGEGGQGGNGFRRPEGGGDGNNKGFRPRPNGDNKGGPSASDAPAGAPPAPGDGDKGPRQGGMGGGGMIGDMLKRMDKDGDGAISKEEWTKANEERFDQMDLNHDGKITKEEAEEAGRKMREMMGGGGRQGGRPQGGGNEGGGTRPRPEGDAPKPPGDAPKPKDGV